MAYLTDRKRAAGLGSAKTGTAHAWSMKVSSVALLILIPFFVFTFGCALTLLVGFKHFNDGVQVLIEDYVHGLSQKVAIILMTCLSYGAAAVGVFAIVKLAL